MGNRVTDGLATSLQLAEFLRERLDVGRGFDSDDQTRDPLVQIPALTDEGSLLFLRVVASVSKVTCSIASGSCLSSGGNAQGVINRRPDVTYTAFFTCCIS